MLMIQSQDVDFGLHKRMTCIPKSETGRSWVHQIISLTII